MDTINILIIDGQGGGIGKNLIYGIKSNIKFFSDKKINIIGAGTNELASKNMKLAGSDIAIYGEQNIIKYINYSHIISGVIGILAPFGIKGEITPKIAEAIFKSNSSKIMVPMNKCNIKIAIKNDLLKNHIDIAINMICEEIKNIQN